MAVEQVAVNRKALHDYEVLKRIEAVIACNVLIRMTELGRPVSFAVGR